MRVVALLTVRNEDLYIERCLRHLHDQGVETCVIDNDSTDRTRSIVEAFVGRGVVRIERLPYKGYFDLVAQCQQQEQLASELDADWFLRQDADEIREAPEGWGSLRSAIQRADAEGFNAIDFAEFVFLPITDTIPSAFDYVNELCYYYYFQPNPLHRVNAWKKTSAPVNIVDSGGHRVGFEGRRTLPKQFVLRHYIGLSRTHLLEKYISRVYSEIEVRDRGWHRLRHSWRNGHMVLPDLDQLKRLEAGSRHFDKSAPHSTHLFRIEAEEK